MLNVAHLFPLNFIIFHYNHQSHLGMYLNICAFATICQQPFPVLHYCEIEDLSIVAVCWMLPLPLSSVATCQITKCVINTDITDQESFSSIYNFGRYTKSGNPVLIIIVSLIKLYFLLSKVCMWNIGLAEFQVFWLL
jgi:hypothetical protein